MLNTSLAKSAAAALLAASILTLAACSSDDKAGTSDNVLSGEHTSSLTVKQGVAGGVAVDEFTAKATVTAVDKSSRKVTLSGSDGSSTTFVAGPEVRNFDQLRVGDRVSATIRQEMVVFTRRGDAAPSASEAAAIAAAPKGAKPGVMMGSTSEIVGRVWSIDNTARKVDLVFSDGEHRIVTPRADVDLTKYRVGDSVVIQMTQTLSVLVVGS